MAKKSKAQAEPLEDTRTPEEIAEERIAEWKRDPLTHRSGYEAAAKYGSKTDWLDLSNLGLKAVPESLRTAHDVEALNLNSNIITEVPGWIGELSKLKAIGLNENQIHELPPEIGSLSKLVGLGLGNNEMETLPEALGTLPLGDLNLDDNPKLGIPESILSSYDGQEILRYYFESRDEKGRPLLELKLLLVGRGKAGKTTLVKQLSGEKPNKNESETHSIEIRELTLDCPRSPVRTRAWDFGGQEILHSTHQFFLTERSLYLLVLEPRSNLAQRDAEYWNAGRRLAGDCGDEL